MARTSGVFTRERFALEVLEPRIQLGPLSDAEVALLRDAALTVYGFDLGARSLEDSAPDQAVTPARPSVATAE